MSCGYYVSYPDGTIRDAKKGCALDLRRSSILSDNAPDNAHYSDTENG